MAVQAFFKRGVLTVRSGDAAPDVPECADDAVGDPSAPMDSANNLKIALHALDAGECSVDIFAQNFPPASPKPVTHAGWGPQPDISRPRWQKSPCERASRNFETFAASAANQAVDGSNLSGPSRRTAAPSLAGKAAMAPVHGKISVAPVAPPPGLNVFRPQNPYVALGLAVNHLMTKPAFANLRFGDWSRILVGQINRKHYCFAVDSTNHIQGFMGWALTSKENAEAWVEGRGALSFADSLDGDCVVFNAWAANTGEVNRFLLGEARKVIEGKDTVYFKRFYKDGSVRPARLRVNDFVAQHLRRQNGETCPPSDKLMPRRSTVMELGSDEER